MKNYKNNLRTTKHLQEAVRSGLKEYYHQAISDNLKRAWKFRKERLSTCKVEM